MMKIIFGALIVLCVALTACGPVHALEYTYNATSGVYNVTAGTADAYHNAAANAGYYADPALKIDEENRDYIASDGKAYPLGLMFQPYHEYNITLDPYAKLLRGYEYKILNESELKEIITLCDNAIQLGNKLINDTVNRGERANLRDALPLGMMISYYDFMKINEVIDFLLDCRYSAISALNVMNASGYDQDSVDDAKLYTNDFVYDDTDAFSYFEWGRIAFYDYYMEQRSRDAAGIRLEQGNYESTKFTVPLDNYTATFELRSISNGGTGRFLMSVKNTSISQEVGSGKEYHRESFKLTNFDIEDADSGTNYLDISIAQ